MYKNNSGVVGLHDVLEPLGRKTGSSCLKQKTEKPDSDQNSRRLAIKNIRVAWKSAVKGDTAGECLAVRAFSANANSLSNSEILNEIAYLLGEEGCPKKSLIRKAINRVFHFRMLF